MSKKNPEGKVLTSSNILGKQVTHTGVVTKFARGGHILSFKRFVGKKVIVLIDEPETVIIENKQPYCDCKTLTDRWVDESGVLRCKACNKVISLGK